MTVNDGKGFWNNEGLCDTLIADCNNAVKQLASGQYIAFCGIVYNMAQKLANLKKGIRAELDSKDEIIEDLKRVNNSLMEEETGIPVDKEGVTNGSN